MTITENTTDNTTDNTTASAATTIHASELRHLRQADPELRILDVRTGGEFESVHIPGSYNVPLDTLAEHVARVADLEHPVVLVCQSGARPRPRRSTSTAPASPTSECSKAGSVAGWRPVATPPRAVRPGRSTVRSEASPARSCWPRSSPA
jgi:hypothetical protein